MGRDCDREKVTEALKKATWKPDQCKQRHSIG